MIKNIMLFASIIIICITTTSNAQNLFYDFDDGTLQGWTQGTPFGGDLSLENSGGNPGGFMVATDTVPGGGALIARAPEPVSGDLRRYLGIWWDEYVYDYGGARVETSIYIRGSDGTMYGSPYGPATVEEWRPRFASFSDSGSWTLLSGSSSFDTVISNVDALFIPMDTSTTVGNRESGIDNVYLAAAPEPVSSTLFVIGGATLGFRRFRKKFKK